MGLRVRDPGRAPHGDFRRRLKGVREVAKELAHLRAGLEAMLRSRLATAVVRDEPAVGNGQERIMRFVVVRLCEEGLVRGDEREAVPIGEGDQLAFDRRLAFRPMPLQFHI
jgi:hypothetical protein